MDSLVTFNPDVEHIGWKLERQYKNLNRQSLVLFNDTCLNEFLPLKYTHTYIYKTNTSFFFPLYTCCMQYIFYNIFCYCFPGKGVWYVMPFMFSLFRLLCAIAMKSYLNILILVNSLRTWVEILNMTTRNGSNRGQ